MQLSNYVKTYPLPEKPGHSLIYSTRTSAMVAIPDQLLDAANTETLTGPNCETLSRLGFLVADRAAEREEMRDIFVQANKKRRQVNATVVMNLDCNLACTYCYEDNFRGSLYMKDETADLLVDRMTRNHIEKGFDVRVSFYGGEPMLSLDLVKSIAERLGAAARANGTKFGFFTISNGTLLTRKVVEDLVPLGLYGAKITTDGPRETHDQTRPFASGSGSYDAIIDNIADICDLIQLHLGGNFTRENYRLFPPLLDEFLSRGITPDKVTSVQFAPVVMKAGEQPTSDFANHCVCSYEPWLIEASMYLREEILKRGFPAPKIRISGCTMEFEADMVVNYEGSIFKCPAFMSDNNLRVGNLREGVGDYRESHNMDLWKNDECLDCAYLPICFGGCRHLTISRTGKMDTLDCRKHFYDLTLEQTIKQDLKYQPTRKLQAADT